MNDKELPGTVPVTREGFLSMLEELCDVEVNGHGCTCLSCVQEVEKFEALRVRIVDAFVNMREDDSE